VYADSAVPVGLFRRIDEAASGALLVYPDRVGEDGRRGTGTSP